MEKGIVKFKDLIIGDRIFQVPIYQRNYSWDKEQLEDLWNDLRYLDKSKKHYFGTILLKKAEEVKHGLKTFEKYDIIDGQQRITSALIFLREIISHLKKLDNGNEDELTKLEEDYLKYKEAYKLEMLGEDDSFFREYVIDDIEYPDATLTPSQRRLKIAKLFFRKRLGENKALKTTEFDKFLIDFIDKIGNLEIIRYPVSTDAEAALIFETVNDRGKQLTNLEKTKSFLMQMVYLTVIEKSENPDPYLRKISESFSNIFKDFEEIRNSGRGKEFAEEGGEDNIQRYHFVLYESVAKGDVKASYRYLDILKRKIRGIYRKDKKKCLGYVLDYSKDLERTFFALKEVISYNTDDEIRVFLKKIYALRVVANFYPLLIASWIRFRSNLDKFREILELIEVFSFRTYAIGRKRSDTGITSLFPLAYKVHKENLAINDIKGGLIKMITSYQVRKDFKVNLKSEIFYTRIRRDNTKYLLFEFEAYLRHSAKEPVDMKLDDILSEKFEIEHIWASNPSKLKLNEEMSKIHEQYKDSLGNLTLASDSWNSKWQNSPFVDKKGDYSDSSLRVQRDLSNELDWGEEQIKKREKQLVKFALNRWKINLEYPCSRKGCDGMLTGLSPGSSGDCPICGRRLYPCPYEGCPGTLEKNKDHCPACKRNVKWN